MEKNEVYVSQDLNDEIMWRKTIKLTQLHWINEAPIDGEEIVVRMRHRGALLPAVLHGTTLTMHEAERAASVGQSAVFYRDGECLGGGIIAA